MRFDPRKLWRRWRERLQNARSCGGGGTVMVMVMMMIMVMAANLSLAAQRLANCSCGSHCTWLCSSGTCDKARYTHESGSKLRGGTL
jgi:hypothetical protein